MNAGGYFNGVSKPFSISKIFSTESPSEADILSVLRSLGVIDLGLKELTGKNFIAFMDIFYSLFFTLLKRVLSQTEDTLVQKLLKDRS